MALASIPIPPDARRDAKAAEHAADVASWGRATLKRAHGAFPAGTEFRLAPSSRPNVPPHWVTEVACSCPDYAKSDRVCWHIRALVRANADARWDARLEAHWADLAANADEAAALGLVEVF